MYEISKKRKFSDNFENGKQKVPELRAGEKRLGIKRYSRPRNRIWLSWLAPLAKIFSASSRNDAPLLAPTRYVPRSGLAEGFPFNSHVNESVPSGPGQRLEQQRRNQINQIEEMLGLKWLESHYLVQKLNYLVQDKKSVKEKNRWNQRD